MKLIDTTASAKSRARSKTATQVSQTQDSDLELLTILQRTMRENGKTLTSMKLRHSIELEDTEIELRAAASACVKEAVRILAWSVACDQKETKAYDARKKIPV